MVCFSARLSIPLPIVALPCGSRSTNSTRCLVAARLAARLTPVVVLPTPPFWFVIASIRVMSCARRTQQNQVPRGVQSGHFEWERAVQFESNRQLRKLFVGIDAFHRHDQSLG